MNRRYSRLGARLAVVVVAVGVPLVAAHPALADQQSPLNGSVGVGEATATTQNPDAGRTVAFDGVLYDLSGGTSAYRGAFTLPGFIRAAHAVGDMVIDTDGGSVSLHLDSGDVAGFAPADGTYTFTWSVTDATGDFEGLQGQGTVDITLIPLFSADDGPLMAHLFQMVQFAGVGDPNMDGGVLSGSTAAA